jgi:ABC-type transporter Mla MlaB component
MKLHMTEHQNGDTMFLRVRGSFAPGPTEVHVWESVRSLLVRGYRDIVIDLARASGHDSSAVSTLLGARLLAQAEGGTVKLLHVTRGFDDLQTIVALYVHFDCSETEESVLHSFAVAPRPTHAPIGAHLAPEAEVA